MLKLSTKSSYGLRACLALSRAGGKLSSSEIAETESIPQRYLEQILSLLRQGGLVESTRGAKGGYSLSRPAGEITVADLVVCLEGALPPILCSAPEFRSESCREDGTCASGPLCHQLESSVMRVLASTTLEAMATHPASLKFEESPVDDAHQLVEPSDSLPDHSPYIEVH